MSDSLPIGSNSVLESSVGSMVQAGTISGGIHIHHQAAVPVIPRQLPPAPAHFIGRDKELAEIDRATTSDIAQPRPKLVVISGSGGVGKTAIALHWFYKNLQRFTDGHLYANLRRFGSSCSVPVTEVLGGFLRALGVPPEQIPLDLMEQTALYRSITAGKSIALFLDDAESAAQVRPFIPISATSVVVVASHWRLGGLSLDGAQFITVEALDEPTALNLLTLIVGRNRAYVELSSSRRLVQLCGGLPIALRVVAARLCTRPNWPVSRIVENLTDSHRRIKSLAVTGEASVQSSFDLSYYELAPATARLYRILSLHPGSEFGIELAAAMGETSPEDAEDMIADLVDANLLRENPDERFRFHDLLRLHAKQHAEQQDTATERANIFKRMVLWYLETAATADVVVMPLRRRLGPSYRWMKQRSPFSDPSDALLWLERELPNLVAAQRCSSEYEWWDLTWQLCECLWAVLLYRKHFSQWFETHELGIEAARRSGSKAAESRLLVQRGIAYLTLENYDDAGADFTEALRLSRETNNALAEATALEHLGLVARKTDTLQAAIDYFGEALSITRRLNEQRGVVLHLRRLGETLFEAGREAEAVEYLQEAASNAADLGDDVLYARSLTRLGTVHVRLGKTELATKYLRDAETILVSAGSHHYLAEAAEASAELYTQVGDTNAAQKSWHKALELYLQSEMPRAEYVRKRLREVGGNDTR